MSKLKDLKAAATAKLANVHADVLTYVSALESKVQSNTNVWYGVVAAGAIVVLLLIVHHLKHG